VIAVVVALLAGEVLRRWAIPNGGVPRWLLALLGAIAAAEVSTVVTRALEPQALALAALTSALFVLVRGAVPTGRRRLVRFLIPVLIVLFTPVELWLIFRLLP
jgi:hypothetical protein